MRTIYIILALFIFSGLSFSQNGWVQVYNNPNIVYKKTFFLNPNTGWVCGDSGKVVKTTNGGFSWTLHRANTVHSFNDVFFLNENTGWAVGGTQNFIGFCYTMSAKTFDGGITWSVSEGMNYYNILSFIYFQNINTGFLLIGGSSGGGYAGYELQTTNGGVNWTGPPDYVQFNYLRKDRNGVLLREYQRWSDAGYTSDSVFIQASTDNGLSWITKSKFNGYGIMGIDLVDENNFSFAVRTLTPPYQYSLLRSSNGGLNWFSIPSQTGAGLGQIYFYSPSIGWCTSNNNLYKTTNAGYNWTNQMSSGGLVYMKDSLNGFCFSTNGKIFITGTGGLVGVQPNTNIILDKFYLQQNYPNPFNPTTKINYELPITNYVSIKVYDALGNEVQTLVNEKQNAGSYSVDFNASLYGSGLPSGIYFYKLVTEKFSETKKMILIK